MIPNPPSQQQQQPMKTPNKEKIKELFNKLQPNVICNEGKSIIREILEELIGEPLQEKTKPEPKVGEIWRSKDTKTKVVILSIYPKDDRNWFFGGLDGTLKGFSGGSDYYGLYTYSEMQDYLIRYNFKKVGSYVEQLD